MLWSSLPTTLLSLICCYVLYLYYLSTTSRSLWQCGRPLSLPDCWQLHFIVTINMFSKYLLLSYWSHQALGQPLIMTFIPQFQWIVTGGIWFPRYYRLSKWQRMRSNLWINTVKVHCKEFFPKLSKKRVRCERSHHVGLVTSPVRTSSACLVSLSGSKWSTSRAFWAYACASCRVRSTPVVFWM